MILQETYTLANGMAIPKLGLGTWFIDNNKAAQAVRTAAEGIPLREGVDFEPLLGHLVPRTE